LPSYYLCIPLEKLLKKIRNCDACEKHLEFGVNPVIRASRQSKIIVVGQAPGRIVHETGIPWNDKSGENLRRWMNVSSDDFYDTNKFALIPMGFCFPGKGKAGDLPPRKECAPLWHEKLFSQISEAKLILLVGQYAQDYYLEDARENLTETVKDFKNYLPLYFPLPHPSPRNNIWQAKNKWFEKEVLPELGRQVKRILR
jgi:uracil-DNA glycosylase family 4